MKKEGNGKKPSMGDHVAVKYSAFLDDGRVQKHSGLVGGEEGLDGERRLLVRDDAGAADGEENAADAMQGEARRCARSDGVTADCHATNGVQYRAISSDFVSRDSQTLA